MNNIITLSQLITRLAKTTGTDTTTARVFLRAFFAGIEQRLVAGESVAIKGIGTFRRSTDPLVGAPNGVVFVPDPEMQEEVNRRFGVFQPVELADTVDESELLSPEPEPEPQPEPAPVPEPAPEVAEPQPEVTQPEPEPEPEESEPEPESAQPEPVGVTTTPAPLPEPEAIVAEPVKYVPEPEEPEEEPASGGHKAFWWIAGAAILIIGAALFLAIFNNPIPKVGWDDEEEPQQQVDSVASDFVIEEVPVEAIAGEVAQETPKVEPEPVAKPAPTPAAPAEQEVVYDTVGKKYYLTTMARKYYGSHVYWVYIYEANKDKLRHPDKLAPGTKVMIPPKSSIPSINNPEEAHRLAEQKAKEIYSRFK